MAIKGKNGAAFYFIYTLVILGFILTMYIVFNQVLKEHVYTSITNNSAVFNLSAQDKAYADEYLTFWDFVPYILIIVALIYLFIRIAVVN